MLKVSMMSGLGHNPTPRAKSNLLKGVCQKQLKIKKEKHGVCIFFFSYAFCFSFLKYWSKRKGLYRLHCDSPVGIKMPTISITLENGERSSLYFLTVADLNKAIPKRKELKHLRKPEPKPKPKQKKKPTQQPKKNTKSKKKTKKK